MRPHLQDRSLVHCSGNSPSGRKIATFGDVHAARRTSQIISLLPAHRFLRGELVTCVGAPDESRARPAGLITGRYGVSRHRTPWRKKIKAISGPKDPRHVLQLPVFPSQVPRS